MEDEYLLDEYEGDYDEPFEDDEAVEIATTSRISPISGLEIKNDREIIVPYGIRFISDWKEYNLGWFQFPHILDKKIPGCGFTEFCLTSKMPIILCSPRKILLENKEEQHRGDVFYFKNELETDLEMDKDLTKIDNKSSTLDETIANQGTNENKRLEVYNRLRKELLEYVDNCYADYKNIKFPKILVTYDSFRLVKEILKNEGRLEMFYVVVDEFQSIFTDSRFKSTTEMEFINQLYGMYKVCFVSATPMIDTYLKEMPEFASLPYYEFNWVAKDPNRAITPDLKIRVVKSITTKANEIIQTYKNKEFEKYTYTDKAGNIQTIESKEAVFYVNSVNNIISIINKAELTPEECNILCSKTDKNEKRIKTRLSKGFSIGRVPLKGEKHKMFTFCTRTVYLGADFYSTNARSFILSDANSECLAVDISLDLPQILGRQRDLSNPWKNRAEFYYRTLSKKKEQTKEAFDEIVRLKKKATDDLLRSYNSTPEDAKYTLAKTYQYVAKSANYRDNYIAVNKHAGNNLVPVINSLVLIAERRAFDIQQVDYKDRFSVFNTIVDEGMIKENSLIEIRKFISEFNARKDFSTKMRMLCEMEMTDIERGILLDQLPLSYKNYYETLGPERLRAHGYNKTDIEREYSDAQFNTSDLEYEIYKSFSVGNRYSRNLIKEIIGNIYKSLGYNKTPKANDLEEYFELKSCKVLDETTGKRDNGFELIKKKGDED